MTKIQPENHVLLENKCLGALELNPFQTESPKWKCDFKFKCKNKRISSGIIWFPKLISYFDYAGSFTNVHEIRDTNDHEYSRSFTSQDQRIIQYYSGFHIQEKSSADTDSYVRGHDKIETVNQQYLNCRVNKGAPWRSLCR